MWYHKGNGLSTEASDDFVPQTYSKFVYTNFELDRRKAGTKRFFYKGDISFLNDLRAVAVIGSREASKGRCALRRPAGRWRVKGAWRGPGLRQRDSAGAVSSQKSPLLTARGSRGREPLGVRPGPRRPWAPQQESWASWLCSRRGSLLCRDC